MTHALCVDWGSSHLRIHRAVDGQIVETRAGGPGAKALSGAAAYRDVLAKHAADWLRGTDHVLVTGMATRRGGWLETPYLPCPADPQGLLGAALPDEVAGVTCHLLPGVADLNGPDVMRGEELQILGMGLDEAIAVLPGTHSKWVRIENGAITFFRTFLTGEIFEFLLRNSLAGQLASGEDVESGFEAGLDAAAQGMPFSAIFRGRAAVLAGTMPPEAVAGYLSGLCIGAEVAEGLNVLPACPKAFRLAAEPHLTELYGRAFLHRGLSRPSSVDRAAKAGFERLLRYL